MSAASGPDNTVVADASLTLTWILNEPYTAEATALLKRWGDQGTTILVPHVLTSEVASALYKRVRRGDLPIEDARSLLAGVLLLDLAFVDDSTLSLRALELAHDFALKAPYDAHYLALAEMADCDFWTADERLWNSVRNNLSRVKWIGSYRP